MPNVLSVCLFSGGIDSSVAALISKSRGDHLHLLSVNYGQVMQRELDSAVALVSYLAPAAHRFIQINGFPEISRSARTKQELIEFNRKIGFDDGYVPSAYPPGRDFTFISLAAAWAETLVLEQPEVYDSARILIGTNETDTFDYPDCQSHVYRRFTELLQSSLKMCVILKKQLEVEAPLIGLTKQQVVAEGARLNLPFGLTWSCYQGHRKACGRCDACRIRYYAFKDSGLDDPIEYEVPAIAPLRVGTRAAAM